MRGSRSMRVALSVNGPLPSKPTHTVPRRPHQTGRTEPSGSMLGPSFAQCNGWSVRVRGGGNPCPVFVSSCLLWHDQRAGRITSSNAHQALRTKNTSTSLTCQICKSSPTPLNTPAVTWGRQHEDTAFQQYTNAMSLVTANDITLSNPGPHQSFTTRKAGLHIAQKTPFLAASPDGLVHCDCCGKGVIEIKCPFTHREHTITFATQSKDFCLNEDLSLKCTHKYYTQVQLQMHICQVSYTDFVVWTTVDCTVCRVARDELFIQEMIGKLCSHWRRAILPELLTRRLELDKCNKTSIPVAVCPSTSRSPQHIQRPTYCICRTSDDSGDMVACDKCDEWFHLRCLKLTVLPRSKKWYCKKCKKAE